VSVTAIVAATVNRTRRSIRRSAANVSIGHSRRFAQLTAKNRAQESSNILCENGRALG
jgi:hypothetical protein